MRPHFTGLRETTASSFARGEPALVAEGFRRSSQIANQDEISPSIFRGTNRISLCGQCPQLRGGGGGGGGGEESDRTRGSVAIDPTRRQSMNIGEIRKNANGQLIGEISS